MYFEILEQVKNRLPKFPKLRRALVGSIIKEIRVDKGIRQIDFAKSVGINESTLKSIENDHQKATTVRNLDQCAKHLDTTTDELILLGRERDPANYFVFKRSAPPAIKGIRQRKNIPEEWYQSERIRFENFDVTPISPPITTKRDFFICRINLAPKREFTSSTMGIDTPVLGFISQGFNISVHYGGKKHTMTGNQSFSLNGLYPHKISNDDDDKSAVIYLMTHLPESKKTRLPRMSKTKPDQRLNIARGIEQIRLHLSDRPNQKISITHLADLTNSLDHEQLTKMMRIKKGDSVVYWEKIEDLIASVGISMEDFLMWCRNDTPKPFSAATAKTRALVDYSTYHGVKLYTCMPCPIMKHDFFCGELFIEGKSSLTRKSWERNDNAMIALYVEEGVLELTVGKRRNVLPILKGESVYFDGSLGYVLRNPTTAQTKAFFATFPGIQI